MKDTRSEIISIANDLIRSVGYNAFSYTDISKKLNIKNAAIHYYFPAKADLGVEVIRRNLFVFNEKIAQWSHLGYRQQLINYITMHDLFMDKYWACIVGSLSQAYDTLPDDMQRELRKLIDAIIDWLSDLLSKGKEAGEFSFSQTPKAQAYLMQSAILSALLMNKVLKNEVYRSIQDSLLSI